MIVKLPKTEFWSVINNGEYIRVFGSGESAEEAIGNAMHTLERLYPDKPVHIISSGSRKKLKQRLLDTMVSSLPRQYWETRGIEVIRLDITRNEGEY